mgnify:CR=1 FL=1
MATVKKHGEKIGADLHYLTMTLRIMSDHTILKNSGDGWKIYKTIKPELDLNECHAKLTADIVRFDHDNPAYENYKKCLHRNVSMLNRSLVQMYIEMMPDDPDGGLSMCEDHELGITIDEMVDMCRKYIEYKKEKDIR